MKQIMQLLTTLLMVVVVQTALGQELTLRGAVLSSGNEPLPNATITIKGTQRSAVSDNQGQFSIKASKGEILVITSVGYLSREFKVGENASIRITLTATDNT